MSETANKKWLTEDDGTKIVPRTLISCVQDEDGNTLQESVDNMLVIEPEETTEIPDDITSVVTSQDIHNIVSDVYDNTKTYSVGDYCIKDNMLYKCNTEITEAEEFDSSKWDATTCASEVNKVNNKLTNYIVEEGIIKDTGAHYRKYANGEIEVWGMYGVEPVYQSTNQTSSTSGIFWSDPVYVPVGVEFVSVNQIITHCYNSGMAWSIRAGYDNVEHQIYANIVQVNTNIRTTYINYNIKGTYK